MSINLIILVSLSLLFNVFTQLTLFIIFSSSGWSLKCFLSNALMLTCADGKFAKSAIAEFVFANKLPLVTTFTRESAPLIFESQIKKQVTSDLYVWKKLIIILLQLESDLYELHLTSYNLFSSCYLLHQMIRRRFFQYLGKLPSPLKGR